MAADREDDRRDAAREQAQQQGQNQGAAGNLRAQIYAKLARIRSGRGESPGTGHGIDAAFDRSVSENAMSTRGSGAEAESRNNLESHRAEMRQAAISGAIRRRAEGHDRADRTWTVARAAKIHARTETRFKRETGGAAGLEEAGRTRKRNLSPQQAMARTTRRAAEAGIDISARKLDVGQGKTKRSAQARSNAGRAFARPGRLEFGGGRAAPPPVRPGPRPQREIQRDRDMSRDEMSRAR